MNDEMEEEGERKKWWDENKIRDEWDGIREIRQNEVNEDRIRVDE